MSAAQPAASPSGRRDFALLWGGQSVSLLGDQCLVLALPLITVGVLHGSASEAALLQFALYVPFLVFGLPAGVLLEMFSRRTAMIVTNLLQAFAFGAVALLAAGGQLNFPVLFIAALLAGVAVVFFQVAYTSYTPCLFEDADDLHKANSRLALSDSLSRTLGPAIGGALLAVIGATGVVATDAISFALASFALTFVKTRDEPEHDRSVARTMWREVAVGLRFVWNHPVVQPVMLCGTAYMFFLSALEASLVLYCREVLGLSTTMTGVVIGAAAAGYPIGNMLSRWAVRRVGVYRALAGSASLSVAGIIAMPALGSLGGLIGAGGLVLGSVLHSIGEGSYSPSSLTLRQLVTPQPLLKRVSAVQRFMLWGAVAAGGLLAAAMIALFSLRTAVWVGALGTATCIPLLLRRDVGRECFRGSGPSAAEPAE
jgi:MFS family permease